MFSYLQIGLQSHTFGLPLGVVEEVLLLPEITPLPDAPGDVVGIIARRGQTLPVIHLARRLGIAEPRCRITDNLVVVNIDGVTAGIIVDRVIEIVEIPGNLIDILSEEFNPPLSSFLGGVGRIGEEILPLINPATLIRAPQAVSELSTVALSDSLGDFYSRFAPDATPQEQAVFYQRRLNLSQQKQEQVQEHFLVALAEVDNEVIGIPLEQVREFVVFEQFVPVPFSPDFILGSINLRSEIVTLINIRALMGLPTKGQAKNKAIVTQSHNSNVGIAVDEIRNITDVDLVSVSRSKEATQGVMGTAILQDEVITIIDLPDLLSKV